MNIYLFGKTSLSGESFFKIFHSEKIKIYPFSREDVNCSKLNLREPRSFALINSEKFKIVSFAPIWDLSYFLNYLFINDKNKLDNLEEVIACSSTSSLTKRFEFNNFDKNLSETLIKSEKTIMGISKELKIRCRIVRPTMIYGSINGKKDKNISTILRIMRLSRFIVLPSNPGLRQPIHAIQLANVFYSLIGGSINNQNKINSEIINVGGDQILDFGKMLKTLQDSLNSKDKAKKCLIVQIPNKIFLILASPVIIISPKYFASICRICSNLSGFNKACQITKTLPINFPFQSF